MLEAYQLKNSSTPSQSKIKGLDAYTFMAEEVTQTGSTPTQTTQQQQTPDNEKLVVHFTLYQYNNAIYILQGMCAKKDYAANKNNFSLSMNGFKVLNDPKRINVVPERINIVAAASDATLKDIMVANKITAERYEEVAILNGMQ